MMNDEPDDLLTADEMEQEIYPDPQRLSGAVPTPEEKPSRFRTREHSIGLPPPSYLLDGLIQHGTDCCLYAELQSLKSFIALDIGLSIATGCKALEAFDVKERGIVFYFAGEGRTNIERKRATAWEIAHGHELFSVTNFFVADGIDLQNVDDIIKDMLGCIGENKEKLPVLFIIDTMNRALNGADEDKSGVAALYLNAMPKYGKRLMEQV